MFSVARSAHSSSHTLLSKAESGVVNVFSRLAIIGNVYPGKSLADKPRLFTDEIAVQLAPAEILSGFKKLFRRLLAVTTLLLQVQHDHPIVSNVK